MKLGEAESIPVFMERKVQIQIFHRDLTNSLGHLSPLQLGQTLNNLIKNQTGVGESVCQPSLLMKVTVNLDERH